MHYGVKDYNSMSEDNAGESKTENFKKKKTRKILHLFLFYRSTQKS